MPMTTAAPPEKMTNAQFANEAENLARDHDNEFPITARILREAVRRLSAPAALCEDCPPVGYPTDKTRCLPCPRRTAAAPAATRVGGDALAELAKWCDRQREFSLGLTPNKDRALAFGDAAKHIRALSAPPAASADEREDRVQVADEMRSYFYEDAAECSPHKYAEFLQCADIALGYRKLAPAQSVGQSAAQGVALPKVWGVSRMADNDQAILVSFRRPPTDDELRALHDHLRRLSALPKGQEHG